MKKCKFEKGLHLSKIAARTRMLILRKVKVWYFEVNIQSVLIRYDIVLIRYDMILIIQYIE